MKIKLKKVYRDFAKGAIIEVTKNVAYGLVEKGIGKVFVPLKKRADTMFRKSNKKVKIK